MIYECNKKKLIQNTKVLWLFVILFLGSFLFGGNSLAATHDYNKQPNGTLEAAEWNLLLTDFVNTWATSTMVGPLGIGTNNPVNKLQIGATIYSGNDFVVGNSNGSVAINNNAGNAYIFGSQRLDLLASGNGISIITGGNVGIGTTTPNNLFQVYGGTGQVMSVSGGQIGGLASVPINPDQAVPLGYLQANYLSSAPGSSAGWLLSGNSIPDDTSWLGSTSNHDISFKTNNAERVRILKGGNVGIGNTLPSYVDSNTVIRTTIGSTSGTTQGVLDLVANTTGTSAGVGLLQFGNYNNVGVEKRIALIEGQTNGAINSGKLNFYTANAGSLGIKMVLDATGNVGIGVTGPGAALDVVSANYPVARATRTTSDTNILRGTMVLQHRTTADMADGFGAQFSFQIRDSAGVDNDIGGFSAERDGADNSGKLSLQTFNAGVQGTRMVIDKIGNVGIGTTAPGVALEIGSGGSLKLSGGTTTGKGNIQLGATASASYDTNLIYLDSTAKTGGYIFGSTPSFTGANGPYFGGRGNTYSAIANQRGILFLSGGNPSTPTGIEGGIRLITADTARLQVLYNGNVGIGTTTPNTLFQVYGGTGQVVNVSGGQIGGLNSTPLNADQAVPLGYLQANYLSSAPSSSAGWLLSGNSIADDNSWLGSISNYDIAFKTNNTERIRILKGGNVGIGTNNPGASLEINKDAGVAFNGINSLLNVYRGTGTNAGMTLGYYSNGTTVTGGVIKSISSLPLFLGTTNNAQTVTILDSGNVGIGTTNPKAKLDIFDGSGMVFRSTSSNADATGKGSYFTSGHYTAAEQDVNYLGVESLAGSTDLYLGGVMGTANAPTHIYFRTSPTTTTLNAVTAMTILPSGNVGIGTTTPNNLFQVYGGTGQVMSVSGGQIGGLNSTPLNADQAVPLGYLQGNYAPIGTAAGSAFVQGGNSFAATATLGTNDNNTLNFETNNGTKMTILAGGNVGIGTTTPGYLLDVNGRSRIQNDLVIGSATPTTWTSYNGAFDGGTNAIVYGAVGDLHLVSNAKGLGTWTYYGNGPSVNQYLYNGEWHLRTAVSGTTGGAITWSDRFTVLNNGNVGIGTTGPGAKLTIEGNGARIAVGDDSVTTDAINLGTDTAGNGIFQMYDSNGVQRVNFYSHSSSASANYWIMNGNVGIGTTTPNNLFQVNGGTGQVMSVSGGQIGGLNSTPLNADQAVPLGYLQSNYSPTSGNLWSGTLNGTIYNGTAGAGNVGIGTTGPGANLEVYTNSAGSIVNLLKLRNNGTTSGTGTGILFQNYVYPSALISSYGDPSFSQRGFLKLQTYDGSGVLNTGMLMDGLGNVGIGTTNPTTNLDVQKDQNATTVIRVRNDTSGTLAKASVTASLGNYTQYLESSTISAGYTPNGLVTPNTSMLTSVGASAGLHVFTYDATPLTLGTNNAANVTILNGGNVGIGTTTPNNLFQVYGGTGQVMSVSGGQIGGLNSVPINADQAVPLGYLQSNYSPTSGNLWSGTLNGTIYNGTAGAGNVGIGTTNSLAKLEIYDGNIVLRSAQGGIGDVAQIGFANRASNAFIKSGIAAVTDTTLNRQGLYFFTSADGNTGTEKVRINSSGYVGIGTTGPNEKLEVSGAGLFTGALANYRTSAIAVDFFSGVSRIWAFGPDATTAGTMKFIVSANDGSPATDAMTINNLGNVGIGTTTPNNLFQVYGGTGQVMNVSGGQIGGLNSVPINADQAVPLGYLQSNYSPTSGNLWSGTLNGTIYNGTAGAGNVGIGTTNPSQGKLQVAGGYVVGDKNYGFVNADYQGGRNKVWSVSPTAVEWGISYYQGGSDYFAFHPNGNPASPVMIIRGDGSVGIGTTNPLAKLQIATAGQAGAPALGTQGNGLSIARADGALGLDLGYDTGGNGYIQMQRYDSVNSGNLFLQPVGGNVGIGTTDPMTLLRISEGFAKTDTSNRGALFLGSNEARASNPFGLMAWVTGAATLANRSVTLQTTDYNLLSGGNLLLNPAGGNVGIGTTDPGLFKLKVAGDVGITGTLQTQMGSDFAEEFATTDNLEPGTVVVMDDHGYKSVRPCTQSYDKTVVGIVSNNPSIIAGRIESEHKAIIAMMGVVKVKVISSNGAISKGDLLTSSSHTGFAMKAVSDKQGTIIGKALENLNSYQGEINVLVNLQ